MKPVITALLACPLIAAAEPAADPPETVHWAFSSFFGTGWYQVEDNRSVFVFSIPPRQTLSRASYDDGHRELGWEIHYPLTLGLHNMDFEDLPGITLTDNFGTASFTPGVEVEIPVNRRLSLRPFAKGGIGKQFETGETAWIWEAGIKSRYTIQSEHVEWSLLGNVHVAGHNASDSDSDKLSSVLLGIEAGHPLQRAFAGQAWNAHWHAAYTLLKTELRFDNGDGTSTPIDDIIELGFALSLRDRPFNFWLWKPHRLGLGIKFSPDGDFSALTFTSRSWFTK